MEMGILTIVALLFWALALAGVEWIAQLISWLFANALIVGLILLIIHICFSAATIRRAYIDYSTKGAFCAIIQAAFPPMIITACYYASLEAVEAQTSIISFSFNWILVFFLYDWNLVFRESCIRYRNTSKVKFKIDRIYHFECLVIDSTHRNGNL